jgi:hypothetical protein
MVKMATVGKSRCNKADKKKSSKKEIKKAAVVLTWPLTVPLKNKITGNRRRAKEPITGIKAIAKAKAAITNKSFKKGILKKVVLNFSKDDNLLTAKYFNNNLSLVNYRYSERHYR